MQYERERNILSTGMFSWDPNYDFITYGCQMFHSDGLKWTLSFGPITDVLLKPLRLKYKVRTS